MITKMTYTEYRDAALKSLVMSKLPQEHIDALDARGCIRNAYNTDANLSDMFQENRFSPSGFAYGCHMLYPDFPDGDEAEKDKPVFDFKFNAARKK